MTTERLSECVNEESDLAAWLGPAELAVAWDVAWADWDIALGAEEE